MRLEYEGKKSESDVLSSLPARFGSRWNHQPNKLIRGDNLPVMKALLDNHDLASKVSLVYIDPPFATKNVFRIEDGRANTISSSRNGKVAFSDSLTDELFLEFMRERLVLLRELMSESASIYVHTDYKVGHYLKVIMDEIFGTNCFRNDITRIKCNPKNFKRRAYGNTKDLILFYSKGKDYTWNDPVDQFTEKEKELLFRKIDDFGNRYTTIPLHAPGETRSGPTGQEWRGMKPPKGRHWRVNPDMLEEWHKSGLIEWSKNGVPRKKIYADEKNGKKKQDVWNYKDKQILSYPTQKNLQLLKDIVLASSNDGDLVLDCFCGSGTTLQAATESNRHWIGIDNSDEAIKVTKERLSNIQMNLWHQDFEYQFLEETDANLRSDQ